MNLTDLTESTIKAYNDVYGDFDPNELWLFLVSDYMATGEGRTISFLITQADAMTEEDTIHSIYYRAIKEFIETHGEFYSNYIEFVPKQVMFERYSNCLPPILQAVSDRYYYCYYSQFHMNAG